MSQHLIHRVRTLTLLGTSLWLAGCVVPGDYSGGSTVYIPTPVIIPRYTTRYVPQDMPLPVYVPSDQYLPRDTPPGGAYIPRPYPPYLGPRVR
jgi:hypothetical protein